MRYEMLWRNKWLTADARSVDEMISCFEASIVALKELKSDGVQLDPEGMGDDYAHFWTEDPEIARKHDMYPSEDEEEIE